MTDKNTVSRLDSFDQEKWMTSRFARTQEGFLQGRAIVTSIGVFTYLNADGSVTRELRLPEEVFAPESLATLKMKPVTIDHPTEKVTPENAKDLQVGTLGTNPSSTNQEVDWGGRSTPNEKLTDGLHVAIDMIITRSDAIAEVENGKRALSMGYECDIELAPAGAVWCGMAYDCIQRRIRYNHCAIVDAARAGDAAKIRLDSSAAVLIDRKIEQGEGIMKKIRIDGVEYEGEDRLVQGYAEQAKRADAAEAKYAEFEKSQKAAISSMEADRDNHKDRADKLEQELKDLKAQALDPKRLDEAVKARVDIMDAAIRAKVEVKDGQSDLDIQKAVVTAVYPTAKLDGKDEAYIKGRFDSAVEELRRTTDAESTAVVGNVVPSGNKEDSAAAYRKMVEYQKAMSRGEKVEG